MSTFVLTNVAALIGGYDITCDSSSASLTPTVDVQDATTFCTDGFRSKRAGLKDVEAELSGYWDGPLDTAAFTSLGLSDRLVTLVPQISSGTAYFFMGGNFEYEAFGGIGDMTPFTLSAQSTNGLGLIRGALVAGRNTTVTSATTAIGSPANLGAGGVGKFAYAAVHITTPGTSLTLQLQQSTTQGGTYTPITSPSTTLGPLTGVGGYLLRVSAATGFTGPWYRLAASTAPTGTFTVAASIGIQ